MDDNYNDSRITVNKGPVSPLREKGGFISLRQNQMRDFTGNLLKIICRDVSIKRTFQQITGKSQHERTANITDKARVDIAGRGFWISDRRAFFDIRYSTQWPSGMEVKNSLKHTK